MVQFVGIERTPRQEKELQIMEWLNDDPSRAAGFFDCGELGVMHIFWSRGGWTIEWIVVEKSPV